MTPLDPAEADEAVDAVMAEPTVPDRLPFGLAPEVVLAWRASLDGLQGDEARVRTAREELRAVRALSEYVTVVQRRYAIRMYLVGATVRAIAKAAGVSDTYVSRRLRLIGLEGRHHRKSRQRR